MMIWDHKFPLIFVIEALGAVKREYTCLLFATIQSKEVLKCSERNTKIHSSKLLCH